LNNGSFLKNSAKIQLFHEKKRKGFRLFDHLSLVCKQTEKWRKEKEKEIPDSPDVNFSRVFLGSQKKFWWSVPQGYNFFRIAAITFKELL